jgi:hypothetical protein
MKNKKNDIERKKIETSEKNKNRLIGTVVARINGLQRERNNVP